MSNTHSSIDIDPENQSLFTPLVEVDLNEVVVAEDNDAGSQQSVASLVANKIFIGTPITLTLIGTLSEGASALFGLCAAFGNDDVLATLAQTEVEDYVSLLILIYILTGATAGAIQSACLEYPYASDFINDPLKIFKQQAHRALQLNTVELASLVGVIVMGASVRGIISTMGYYALYNNMNWLAAVAIYVSAVVDVILTIATDGSCLQKSYLWLRSDKTDAEQQLALRDSDETYPACETTNSKVLYGSVFAAAALTLLGEVGVAMFALEKFTQLQKWDSTSPGFYCLSSLSLASFFLVMAAMDCASPANILTCAYENWGRPVPPVTTSPKSASQQRWEMAAFAVSFTGASVKGFGTYGGSLYFLKAFVQLAIEKPSQPLMGGLITISVILGLIRAVMCACVEGVATQETVDRCFAEVRESVETLPVLYAPIATVDAPKRSYWCNFFQSSPTNSLSTSSSDLSLVAEDANDIFNANDGDEDIENATTNPLQDPDANRIRTFSGV